MLVAQTAQPKLSPAQMAQQLFVASQQGNAERVRLLIEQQADVNVRTSTGDTPLMVACAQGSFEVVQLLLLHEFQVEEVVSTQPMMGMVGVGRVDQRRRLVQRRSAVKDVNVKNQRSDTALLRCAAADHWVCAKLLVEAQADVNAQDDSGNTTLMLAAAAGHSGLLRILASDARTNLNLLNHAGDNALLIATRAGHAGKLIRHVPPTSLLEDPLARAFDDSDLFHDSSLKDTPQGAARKWLEENAGPATA